MKRIVVTHLASVSLWPPVINLLENLLHNGNHVFFVGCDVDKLSSELLEHPHFQYTNIEIKKEGGLIFKIMQRIKLIREGRKAVKIYMQDADILWTTTDRTLLFLGRIVKPYKHVLQLMELVHFCPYLILFPYFKFPIEKYAERAWKVIVPEINRAYIQKVYWNLSKVPIVLPNKPYKLFVGEMTKDIQENLDILKNEKRKILLYLGVFCEDRNFDVLIETVEKIDGYCLYLIGKPSLGEDEIKIKEKISKYNNVRYLGYFPAPKHLVFLQYAHIGLLPYSPSKQVSYLSELNALYCAPNKIFEYSGYGVPMLGSDVLGLKIPFEMYHIGVCYSDTTESVIQALNYIEENYEEMKKNCYKYFESVDLDQIVKDILEESE